MRCHVCGASSEDYYFAGFYICELCGGGFCKGCREFCDECESLMCPSCAEECRQCGKNLCVNCIDEHECI